MGKEEEKRPATPLPKGQLFVVGLVTFSNFFSMNVIFPMLPFMTHDFFPHLQRSQLGFYAGFLASSYHLGSLIGNILWGRLSDNFGRRPVFLFGLFSSSFAVTMFGLSVNFRMALSARFLWGLLCANFALAKTFLSEVCDDTNQAKAFSIMGICAGVGRLLAVSVGGFLSQPAQKYAIFKNYFFCRFPFFLPCLISLMLGVMSLFVAWRFLLETAPSQEKKSKKTKKPRQTELLKIEGKAEEGTATFLKADGDEDASEDKVILPESSHNGTSSCFCFCRHHCQCQNDDDFRFNTVSAESGPHRQSSKLSQAINFSAKKVKYCCTDICSMIKLLKNKSIGLSVLEYGCFAFVGTIANEVISLLLVTDGAHGGYCFDSSQIALPLTGVIVFQIFFQFFIYHRIVAILKFKKTFLFGVGLFAASAILVPFLVAITGPIHFPNATSSNDFTEAPLNSSGYEPSMLPTTPSHFSCLAYGFSWYNSTLEEDDSGKNSTAKQCYITVDGKLHTSAPYKYIRTEIWFAVAVIVAITYLGRSIGFTSVNVLVCNSSKRSIRGSVNGLSQSGAALARTIAPSLGSYIFAWSQSNGLGYPFNYHFVFGFMASVCVVVIVIGLFLPKSASNQFKEEDSDANGEDDGGAERCLSDKEEEHVELVEHMEENKRQLTNESTA